MINHYLQRGFKPIYIINLPVTEKMFYMAGMEICIEEESEKYKALGGD